MEKMPEMSPNGARRIFPTDLDLAIILGNTDFDIENIITSFRLGGGGGWEGGKVGGNGEWHEAKDPYLLVDQSTEEDGGWGC